MIKISLREDSIQNIFHLPMYLLSLSPHLKPDYKFQKYLKDYNIVKLVKTF